MSLTLQEEIKRLRKVKNLTQGDVADRMRLPKSTYARKEAAGDFSESDLLQLSKVLGAKIKIADGLSKKTEKKAVIKNEMRFIVHQMILQRSCAKVLLSSVAELLAETRGESVVKVLQTLEAAVEAESEAFLKKPE